MKYRIKVTQTSVDVCYVTLEADNTKEVLRQMDKLEVGSHPTIDLCNEKWESVKTIRNSKVIHGRQI